MIEDKDALLLQTPDSLANTLNLDVRIEQEVTQLNPDEHTVSIRETKSNTTYMFNYDKLILCPGANPVLPDLPGICCPAIHTLRNIEDMDAIKQKLIVDLPQPIENSNLYKAHQIGVSSGIMPKYLICSGVLRGSVVLSSALW